MGTIFGNTPCNVLRGELAIKTDPEKQKSEEEPLNYRTVYTDQPAMFQDFDDDIAVAPLLGNQAPLLAGVKSKEERYKLFITKGRLEWGSSLKMNDPVLVSFKDSQAAETEATRKATAVIQYVGPVKGEKGIMFGVEIVVSIVHRRCILYSHDLCVCVAHRSHISLVRETPMAQSMESTTSPVGVVTGCLSRLTDCQSFPSEAVFLTHLTHSPATSL